MLRSSHQVRFLMTCVLIPWAQGLAADAPQGQAAEQAWLRHGFSDAQRERVREAFQAGIDRKFIPGGALLILHRGEPIFREAFGVADLETGRLFTVDAPCRIASVTKPHTATLLALLVDRGKLSWDDPIDKHLTYFAGVQVRGKGPAARMPQIRELLSHTAGFPGQAVIDSGEWKIKIDGTLADAVEDLPRQGLAAEPGSGFAYTGLGYMVAGRIAEVVMGKEFAALMHEQLLAPIGSTTATFDYSEQIQTRMPTPYERKNGEFVKLDPASRPGAAATFPNPGGRLISILDDVGRFLLLHRNRGLSGDKRLAAADTLRELYKPQPATGRQGYGLGFNVLKLGADGYGVRIRHTGASGTLAELDFENDLGIVVLTQVPQTQTQPFRDRLLREIYAVMTSTAEQR